MARALVVRVGVRQGVERHRSAAQPAKDAPGVESRGRVDQDRSQQIDIDQVRGKALENEQVVSELFHVIPAVLCRSASNSQARS